MKLTFTDEAWDEYLYWQSTDKKNTEEDQYPH